MIPRRDAYTLLELMIALGLLGALMSVAWSLMATFRDAEQRGWKITQRTQVIRSAHSWLQSDAQHVSRSVPLPALVGTSLGFVMTIQPSLDPLPFLERLMTDGESADAGEQVGKSETGGRLGIEPALTADLFGGDDFSDALNTHSPWNRQRMEIEYELLPVDFASEFNSTGSSSLDDTQFALVRRELFGGSATTNERVLTGQDLYRQQEEPQSSRGIALAELRLEGLVRPQFQYCDGRTWKTSWNSRIQGGLPTAIALGFDFPARAHMVPPTLRRAHAATEDEFESATEARTDLLAADMALASEGQIELNDNESASLLESATFEVQMVIRMSGGY